jgi:hypothetical protein
MSTLMFTAAFNRTPAFVTVLNPESVAVMS